VLFERDEVPDGPGQEEQQAPVRQQGAGQQGGDRPAHGKRAEHEGGRAATLGGGPGSSCSSMSLIRARITAIHSSNDREPSSTTVGSLTGRAAAGGLVLASSTTIAR
jgi:hypothetical protein